MHLTKSKLKQLIKEELESAAASPAKLVSQILRRSLGSSPVPSDIASDPAYAARGYGLQEGEYNIRGQYLVYRLDGQLMTINLGAAEPQHWPLINDALRQAGWRENESAGIPTPEDFAGALNEVYPITPAIHAPDERLMARGDGKGRGVIALTGKGEVLEIEDESPAPKSAAGGDFGSMSDIEMYNQLVATGHSPDAQQAYYSLLDEASIRQLKYLIEQELDSIEER